MTWASSRPRRSGALALCREIPLKCLWAEWAVRGHSTTRMAGGPASHGAWWAQPQDRKLRGRVKTVPWADHKNHLGTQLKGPCSLSTPPPHTHMHTGNRHTETRPHLHTTLLSSLQPSEAVGVTDMLTCSLRTRTGVQPPRPNIPLLSTDKDRHPAPQGPRGTWPHREPDIPAPRCWGREAQRR